MRIDGESGRDVAEPFGRRLLDAADTGFGKTAEGKDEVERDRNAADLGEVQSAQDTDGRLQLGRGDIARPDHVQAVGARVLEVERAERRAGR